MSGTSARRIDVWICIVLFLAGFLFFAHFCVQAFETEDEVQDFYAAKKLLEKGEINIFNPLNEEYSTFAFGPGWANYQDADTMYPGINVGRVLFYAALMGIAGEKSFFFAPPFFCGLSLVAIYFIALKLLKSRKYALLSSVLLFSMPIFGKWAVSYFINMATLSLFLFSFLLLIKPGRPLGYAASGTLVSLAFLLRSTEILLAIPLFIYLVVSRAKVKNMALFVLPMVISVLLVYPLLNYLVCHDPFFYQVGGYRYYSAPASVSAPIGQVFSWVGSGEALSKSFAKFIGSDYAFTLLPLSFVGLIIFYRKNRAVTMMTITLILVLILFYGKTTNTHGFFQETLHASLLRYMLPAYALLAIMLAYFFREMIHLSSLVKYERLALSIIVVFALFMLQGSLEYKNWGIDSYNKRRENNLAAKMKMEESTDADGIFISDIYGQKILLPERENIIYLSRLPKEIRQGEILRIAEQALEDGRHVYFIANCSWQYNSDKATREIFDLLDENLGLTELSKTTNYYGITTFEINGP